MLQIYLPTNENEFTAMMEEVDRYLRQKEIPPHARPIRGWFEISKALNLGLSMFPREEREPRRGIYSGDDLTIRIFRWFDNRYGDKLKINMGPGRFALMIRGDPWELLLPKVFGTVNFFISSHEKSSNQEEDLKLRRIPKINILDLITIFPQGLAASLKPAELEHISISFIQCYKSV